MVSWLRGFGQVDLEHLRDAAWIGIERDHAVAEIDRFFKVVGDEHHGGAARLDEAQDFVLQRLPRHGVERAERLVHQQHRGLLRETARDLHALLHAARELGRKMLGVARRGRPCPAGPRCARRAALAGTPLASSASETLPAAVRHGSSALL